MTSLSSPKVPRKKGSIIVARDKKYDAFGHETLGGIQAERVAAAITEGTNIETRCVILSHIQRGGAPCAYDRRMGRYFGIAAVNLIDKKNGANWSATKKEKSARSRYKCFRPPQPG